jgi:hypothetical protein
MVCVSNYYNLILYCLMEACEEILIRAIQFFLKQFLSIYILFLLVFGIVSTSQPLSLAGMQACI